MSSHFPVVDLCWGRSDGVEHAHCTVAQDDHGDGGGEHPEEGEQTAMPEWEVKEAVTEGRVACTCPGVESTQQEGRQGQQLVQRVEGAVEPQLSPHRVGGVMWSHRDDSSSLSSQVGGRVLFCPIKLHQLLKLYATKHMFYQKGLIDKKKWINF